MFEIIVPFYNGHQHLDRLLASIPETIPVTLIDDLSDSPIERPNTKVIRLTNKGYFTGAVNKGLEASSLDVLILNQDTYFTGNKWLNFIDQHKGVYGLFGERAGTHPAWPQRYVHGTFMYIRRDVIDAVGLMDAQNFPHWGSTCEYQLRACRKGFMALPVETVPDFVHKRRGPYGSATQQALANNTLRRGKLIRTPPLITVVITCYNYGCYLKDAVHSLIGGPTSLGQMPGQTFQAFEIVIVDDGSTDNSVELAEKLADDWQGIKLIQQKNKGSAGAMNAGINQHHIRDGHLIAPLDGDDMMEPERLERMLGTYEANPDSVIFDNVQYFGSGKRGVVTDWETGKEIKRLKLPSYDFDRMLHKNGMHKGLLYPKRAWNEAGGYPVIMNKGREDWAFNIALGIKGWCGVNTGYFDYLYRREGQNRTLNNTNPKWHQIFLQQLRELFPDIYEGHRPMACCGRGQPTAQSNGNKQSMVANNMGLTGQEGMVILEYIGGNSGDETWYGDYGTYILGGVRKQGYVDVRDRTKLLNIRDNGKQVFVEVKAEMPDWELEKGDIDYDEVLKTVSSVRDAVGNLDPPELETLLKKERDGKNRSTAIDAIEVQLERVA